VSRPVVCTGDIIGRQKARARGASGVMLQDQRGHATAEFGRPLTVAGVDCRTQ